MARSSSPFNACVKPSLFNWIAHSRLQLEVDVDCCAIVFFGGWVVSFGWCVEKRWQFINCENVSVLAVDKTRINDRNPPCPSLHICLDDVPQELSHKQRDRQVFAFLTPPLNFKTSTINGSRLIETICETKFDFYARKTTSGLCPSIDRVYAKPEAILIRLFQNGDFSTSDCLSPCEKHHCLSVDVIGLSLYFT